MNLTVLQKRQQVYAREQAFGGGQLTQDIARHYGMSIEDAEAAKRAGNLPEGYEVELLNPFMENLALEVSRALQFFFTSTQYNQVDHIVLAGGCAVIPGLMKWLPRAPRSIPDRQSLCQYGVVRPCPRQKPSRRRLFAHGCVAWHCGGLTHHDSVSTSFLIAKGQKARREQFYVLAGLVSSSAH